MSLLAKDLQNLSSDFFALEEFFFLLNFLLLVEGFRPGFRPTEFYQIKNLSASPLLQFTSRSENNVHLPCEC